MSSLVLNRNYQLQLPSSFTDVERDEMEYVDGGKVGVWKAGWWIDQALIGVGILISGGFALAAAKTALRKNAGGLTISATKGVITNIGLSWGANTATKLGQAFAEWNDFSVGVTIAKAWDSIDGYPNDNELDWL